jgi:GAF domain-containing protein
VNPRRLAQLFLEPIVAECELAALVLYRITREGLVLVSAAGDEAAAAPARLALGGCPAGVAARKGERRRAHDVDEGDVTVPGTCSELVEPVLFDGLPLGALVAADSSPAGVTDWTVQLAALLAARLAPVLAWPDEDAALAAAQAVDKLAERFTGRFDWTGVYARAGEDHLQLVAFVGEPTVHVRIPVDTGLCGAAVRENAVQNVADVRSDPRYLACSLRTRSELVVPIRDASGAAVAEIDIDSDHVGVFPAAILSAVEAVAAELAPFFSGARPR